MRWVLYNEVFSVQSFTSLQTTRYTRFLDRAAPFPTSKSMTYTTWYIEYRKIYFACDFAMTQIMFDKNIKKKKKMHTDWNIIVAAHRCRTCVRLINISSHHKHFCLIACIPGNPFYHLTAADVCDASVAMAENRSTFISNPIDGYRKKNWLQINNSNNRLML